MIAALSQALIERGNVPAIINIGPTTEDIANASRQLLRYRAEATVFLSGSPPESLVELTRRNGQPLILINRAETDLDSVHCDDMDGAQQAFEALSLTGASRFAVINKEVRARAWPPASRPSPGSPSRPGSSRVSCAPVTPIMTADERRRAGCWRADRRPTLSSA